MAGISKRRKALIDGKSIQQADSKSQVSEQDTHGAQQLRSEDSITRDDALRAELKARAANPLGAPDGDFPF